MPRRSQAQEDAVHKAAKVSGVRRKAAAERRRDTELREAPHRAEVDRRADCPRCKGMGGYIDTDENGTEMRPCVNCGGIGLAAAAVLQIALHAERADWFRRPV